MNDLALEIAHDNIRMLREKLSEHYNPEIDDADFLPLVRSSLVPLTPEQRAATVRHFMKNGGMDREEAHAAAEEARKREEEAEIWASPQYTVMVYRDCGVQEGWPPMDWLSIRRDDRAARMDWRHKQEIKNQLCGPDREGVELFPNEERLTDTSNQYHLWVLREPGIVFPFGFAHRMVLDVDPETAAMGAKQRPQHKQ